MSTTMGDSGDSVAPLLSVSDLEVRFGLLTALHRVNLTVQPGELVALAGENGAGKTTLVRCIAGDIAPVSGRIALDGTTVPADPLAAARQGISVVWQDLALCRNLDIAANLLLGRERPRQLMSGFRFHADAADLLVRLGIPLKDTTRGIWSLSGGQRQLVAVARAMAHRPRLLLLDEPTAALGVQESALVEDLIGRLRAQGTAIVLACHDIGQMFRLADRIVVLRQGQVVTEVSPGAVHPDDVSALLSGQEVASSARRQLTRLHGLADRLVSADSSSSLSLILSALGAALGSDRLCIHLLEGPSLVCAASLGLSPLLLSAWTRLPLGPAGGPAGLCAGTDQPVVAEDVRTNPAWAPFRDLAGAARIASSWSVPVMGPHGPLGVITVFGTLAGEPQRDHLDLATLYAGYAASAIERDRLLDEVTARNRVLETTREMLETLAGPTRVADGLAGALQSLRRGLQAEEVALVTQPSEGPVTCRASAHATGPPEVTVIALDAARVALAAPGRQGTVTHQASADGGQALTVALTAPGDPAALVARWRSGAPSAEAPSLLENGAHSLRLALEREQAWLAHQEAMALRRSRELQRGFLSRLSHELRTPLTAIKGYASSLLQPDVTWDSASQQRFIATIATESARLGRLVDDLLDYSAIEAGTLRLQRDWCDISLVLAAAIACLPPEHASMVAVQHMSGLPAVWADHDRLEQVFVNLLVNALGHNPPGTRVRVSARTAGLAGVAVRVTDDGAGLPADVADAPFDSVPRRRKTSAGSGAGLGLSIVKGIVTAHGGQIELERVEQGTCFLIHLPAELPAEAGPRPHRPQGQGHEGTAGGSEGLTAEVMRSV